MATGIISKPPAKSTLTRVSPGVYRDAKGNLTNSSSGSSSSKKKSSSKDSGYLGLNKAQTGLIKQQEGFDQSLGNYAGEQMPAIGEAYKTNPWEDMPDAPWKQFNDIKGMSQSYQDEVYNNFARNAEPQFQNQMKDFEQQMANQGIPIGSKLYDQQKKALMDTQENQRQNIRTNALTASDGYANNWNNMGTQNYQNAYQYGQAQRDQALTDYQKLQAAQSGMRDQNLGYSQGLGTAKFGADQQIRVAKSVPRGGGGGGGGGAGPVWAQYGFSSPMEYDQYKINQARDQASWEANQARKNQPNPWLQVGGSLLGSFAQGIGSSFFK